MRARARVRAGVRVRVRVRVRKILSTEPKDEAGPMSCRQSEPGSRCR